MQAGNDSTLICKSNFLKLLNAWRYCASKYVIITRRHFESSLYDFNQILIIHIVIYFLGAFYGYVLKLNVLHDKEDFYLANDSSGKVSNDCINMQIKCKRY